MATPKKGGKKRGGGSSKPPDKDDKPYNGEQKPPPTRGNPDADPVKIHREYVERRVGGGAPPTPDAYERAIEQWHKLPGSVSTPPTDIRPERRPSGPEEEENAQSQGDDGDKPRGS